MNITSGINRIKSAIALVFMCSVFGLTVMAQTNTDKPMTAKSLAALVVELKGIISGLAPTANEAAMVSEKWDARRDLVGKTKKDVIYLLFQDVRAVIKDSGVL